MFFRILPSTSISLVAELQASGGFDVYGQEIQNLAPRGWAKINIFDHLHQVMSGHWKVPIRLLPVKPSLTEEQLNGVPQVRRNRAEHSNSLPTQTIIIYKKGIPVVFHSQLLSIYCV